MVRESAMVKTPSSNEKVKPRRDYGRWILWVGYAVLAALGVAVLAFLAGYLTAVHVFSGVLRTDKATIMRLNEGLQAAHTKLSAQKMATPPAHGFWLWWAGLPFRHLGPTVGHLWHQVVG